MFERGPSTSTEALAGLLEMLAALDEDVSDAERVDRLAALERVKSAVAAAQARITVEFVESQEQVARQWRQRARECADGNDFEGWRAARERGAASRSGGGRGDRPERPTAGAAAPAPTSAWTGRSRWPAGCRRPGGRGSWRPR